MSRKRLAAAIVDVRWGVHGILAAIEMIDSAELVLLRRHEGDRLMWYARTAEQLRAVLTSAAEDDDVTRLLDLHETGAAPFHDLDEGPPDDTFYGVATGSDGTICMIEPAMMGSGPMRGVHIARDSRATARRLFPLIEGPERVAVDASFLLKAGLADKAVAGVAGVPFSMRGERVVEAQVSAPDFELQDGECWRHELPVEYGAPLPTFELHLTAKAEGLFPISVSYSIAGEVVGFGVRYVSVGEGNVAAMPPAGGAGFSTENSSETPDLTVTVVVREKRGYWTFQSPHAGIDLPDGTIDKGLGDEPKLFAKNLLLNVPSQDTPGGDAYGYVVGAGDAVSTAMPSVFWKILAQVGKAAGDRPLRLLLLTNDPYVPWELAKLDQPFDATVPPLLGAQVDIGRWVVDPDEVDNSPRPPEKLDFDELRVFWADYEDVRLQNLPEAREESEELERIFQAGLYNASRKELNDTLDLLKEEDRPHGLHFAGHGAFGDGGLNDGLKLGDGNVLNPFQVRGKRPFLGSPFVFLNACEVGAANSTVGGYGGMAGAFLRAGAGGVLAPLWKVNDAVARRFSLEFYHQVISVNGAVSAASAMRSLRARFTQGSPSTWVAYQYWGHPALAFTRRRDHVGRGSR